MNKITLDRYDHLQPGSARIALGLLQEIPEKQLA